MRALLGESKAFLQQFRTIGAKFIVSNYKIRKYVLQKNVYRNWSTRRFWLRKHWLQPLRKLVYWPKLSDLGININNLLLVYGDHKGKPELRELIVKDLDLTPDDVLITSGAATALFILATSFLEKNDHIVIAKSNYATNIETPRAIGAKTSYLDLRFEENYDLDLGKLSKLITKRTKLVSLTYPHNPTGVQINEEKLRAIIDLIERKGTYLLLDETYWDMFFSDKLPIAATLSDKVISVSSMSKSYGLPGIRIGWILSRNKALMEIFLAAKEQICITNSVVDEEVAYHFNF